MKRFARSENLDFYANHKTEIDNFASIMCTDFGNIILLCMGKNAECKEFSLKDENRYNLNYIENNNVVYRIFSYDEIKEVLQNKSVQFSVKLIENKDPEC